MVLSSSMICKPKEKSIHVSVNKTLIREVFSLQVYVSFHKRKIEIEKKMKRRTKKKTRMKNTEFLLLEVIKTFGET